MPKINQNELASLRVAFPATLSEQEEVSDYLDKKCAGIDNLINLNQRLLIELENYKQSLIYDYVTGKKEVV